MNGYTIISKKYVGIPNGKAKYVVTIVANEIPPEPLPEWTPGSVCLMTGNSEDQYSGVAILNIDREWIAWHEGVLVV